MINHYFATLFNRTTEPSLGVYNPLSQVLTIPDALRAFYRVLGENTVEDSELMAARSIKVVAASQYRDRLLSLDSRTTFDPFNLLVDEVNSVDFIYSIIGLPASTVNAALSQDTQLRTTFRNSDITQERASAVIVGVVEGVTRANG